MDVHSHCVWECLCTAGCPMSQVCGAGKSEWPAWGSNPRPSRYQHDALTNWANGPRHPEFLPKFAACLQKTYSFPRCKFVWTCNMTLTDKKIKALLPVCCELSGPTKKHLSYLWQRLWCICDTYWLLEAEKRKSNNWKKSQKRSADNFTQLSLQIPFPAGRVA